MIKLRLKKKFKIILTIIILISSVLLLCKLNIIKINHKTKATIIKNVEKIIDKEKIEYEKCLEQPFLEENYTDIFLSKITQTNEKLQQYKTYVSYSEFDENYYYGYEDDQVIYGASLIKLVDALYIVENNVDISTTIKYESKYYSSSNKGLNNHKVGEYISIDNLVKYILNWSDNGAHQMLVKYIGFNNLQNYGKSLGAKHTLEGGDNFGYQTTYDTNIYVRRIYELSKTNETAAKFLNYMKNDYYNFLKINDLTVAHKYGYYSTNFHNIGIIYDLHPYAISILTQYGKTNFQEKIQEINQIVFELHQTFWQEKEAYCHNLAYKK